MSIVHCALKDVPSLTYNVLAFNSAIARLETRRSGRKIDLDSLFVGYDSKTKLLIYIQTNGQREILKKQRRRQFEL